MPIQSLPLNQLSLSRNNPRKQIDPQKLEGLAASIAADGLLQSLVVQPKAKNKFEIIAGERRYRALKLLASRGEILKDYPVSVTVKKSLTKEERHRVATMENVQREALNPADEADAIAKMVRQGAELDDIAARTGLSESTIKRRLAVAALCPEAKTALREGTITLSVAEALTLGAIDAQRDVMAQMDNGWGHWSAADIREHLTAEKPVQSMAIFPLERYEGTYTSDLFAEAETTYFDDLDQFRRLQEQAVQQLYEQYAQSHDWVAVCADYTFEQWRYDQAPEGECGGAVIHFRPDFDVKVYSGLQKRRMREDADKTEQHAPREKPEYSQKAQRYMDQQKSLAIQGALLLNPRKGREVIAAMMLAHVGNLRLTPYDCHSAEAQKETQAKAYNQIEEESARLQTLLQVEPIPLTCSHQPPIAAWEWLAAPKEATACYAAVQKLGDEDLEKLTAVLFTLTLGLGIFGYDRENMLATVAGDLDVAMREWWRPDEEFLNMHRKEQLLKIAVDSGANKLRSIEGDTKVQMVKDLATHFERCAAKAKISSDPELNLEIKEAAQIWCPPTMTFQWERG